MINKKNIICPSCGSKDVEKIIRENSEQLTLGSKFFFQEIYFKCHSCDTEADFFHETDANYLIAKKKAKTIFVKEVIESLHNKGISMTFFERVFELPFRTLTRWKTGDFSAAALALLRIVKTYPWITDVAEHRFSASHAENILLTTAKASTHEENAIKTLNLIKNVHSSPTILLANQQVPGG